MPHCKAKDIWGGKNKAKGIYEHSNSTNYVETKCRIAIMEGTSTNLSVKCTRLTQAQTSIFFEPISGNIMGTFICKESIPHKYMLWSKIVPNLNFYVY